MEKELIENLYNSIIEDDLIEYKKIFESSIEDDYIDYWKKAINFYDNLDDLGKETFYTIIKTVMIDTVSAVFGVLDGTSSIDDKDWDFGISVNKVDITGELQDAFLEYVEEVEEGHFK